MLSTIRRRTALVAAALAVAATTVAPSAGAARPAVADAQVGAFAARYGLTRDAAASYFGLTHAVAAVQDQAMAAYPGTFAGLWRTPDDGGLLHVAFTADAEAATRAVTRGFPRPGLVRAHTATTSLRDLDAAAARVADALPSLAAAGVAVDFVGVDVAGNRVRADVTTPVAAAVARIAGAAGVAVDVAASLGKSAAAGLCQRSSCPLELVGGAELTGGGFACTSGFAGSKGGRRVLVTAGHCFAAGTPVANGAVPIGTVTSRVFPGSGDAELVQVEPDLPVLFAATNDVIWTNAGSTVGVFGVAGRTVSETVGAPVCRTGITTENQCGVITALNTTVSYTQGLVSGLTRTTACAAFGDSGGPFMSSWDAYGITSGITLNTVCGINLNSFYTPAGRAESLLGARINTA